MFLYTRKLAGTDHLESQIVKLAADFSAPPLIFLTLQSLKVENNPIAYFSEGF